MLAAVAEKGVKELAYHRDHAARWTVRLGDGTAESHRRMQAGLDAVWPYVEELFRTSAQERALPGIAVDPAGVRAEFDAVLDRWANRDVFEKIGGRWQPLFTVS